MSLLFIFSNNDFFGASEHYVYNSLVNISTYLLRYYNDSLAHVISH